jgi:hypothetical protein
MNKGIKLHSLFILIILFSILPVKCIALEGEQKAIDLIYRVLNPLGGQVTAIWDEKATTSDGKSFPCHKYTVTKYDTDLSAYGPPVAYSSSITFSSSQDVFKGIYLTVYILSNEGSAEEFLKKISENWIVNGSYQDFKTIEITQGEQRNDLFIICGKYVIREETFNTDSNKDKILQTAEELNICTTGAKTDISGEITTDTGTSTDDTGTVIPEVQPDTGTQTTQPDTTVVPDTPETEEVQTTEEETTEETPEETETQTETTEPSTTISTPVIPVIEQTPYENWMNSWNIVSTDIKSSYVIDTAGKNIDPPGGGDKMIVLKPKDDNLPAEIEGKFEPKSSEARLYMRIAAANRQDASALLVIDINGFPALPGRMLYGTTGWQDIYLNVGGYHAQLVTISIKIYPDPNKRSSLDYIYIDELTVDGKPLINKKFKVVSGIPSDIAQELKIPMHGLWTDLNNFSYKIIQTGDTFTFSSSGTLYGKSWDVRGTGTILTSTTIRISFIDTYGTDRTGLRGTAKGEYNSENKEIVWTTTHPRFPTMWFFIK